ncbi:hypothetical protein [Aeoliella mucimassa]|uniref:Uncharacterized protein n=1 Tax=Aeoliella mucimassa TaxID=2527972 RepID=A0A518ASU5_9BACT|nr:hypothetical protein [Aeoliella mucimassa]QDU57798.1 hypothetical protein Pan181_40210 [Aeoliella mucimassa]
MNGENAYQSPETASVRPPRRRHLLVRIGLGCLWFLVIWFVSNAIIGGFVGAMAGANVDSPELAAQAGFNASVAFFDQYRMPVLATQICGTILLGWFGILPGTREMIK